MNKRANIDFNGGVKRGLTVKEGAAYTGLGVTHFRKWAEEVGATRRFGKSVRYDRIAIDQALDRLGEVVAK